MKHSSEMKPWITAILDCRWKRNTIVKIAAAFRRVPQGTSIAMARSSQLEGRLAAIVDASRCWSLRPVTMTAILAVAGGIIVCLAGCKPSALPSNATESGLLREQQIARLKLFSADKEKQSHTLAAAAGTTISKDFQRYFDAASRGDWRTVNNRYEYFERHHPNVLTKPADVKPGDSFWQPVVEIEMAYEEVVMGEPKYTQTWIDGVLSSISPGSIYFGGTDCGRGLPTAFSKSHAGADPFFTLTQNQLVNAAYLDYLRAMYGKQINLPSSEDLSICYSNYLRDAELRLRHDTDFPNEPKQLKPNEHAKFVKEGNRQRVQVSGEVAVMQINGLLARVIFDRNPGREFYIEEYSPLDWMYPHLEPHGLILKINRTSLAELSDDIVRRDHDYWTEQVKPMIGDWITYDTTVQQVAAFAKKVHLKRDFLGFGGDPRFVQNVYAQAIFSRVRASIAGIYAWRITHATGESEKTRMAREADFAFREAWALCPYLPGAVNRYVDFLKVEKRIPEAILVTETVGKFPSSAGIDTAQFRKLAEELRKTQ